MSLRSSEQVNDLAAAIAKAQGAITQPTKDKTANVQTLKGATYKFSYVSLDSVLEAVRKPLSDNGLSLVQGVCGDGQHWTLTTRIMHGGGQWIESDYPLNFAGTPQERGSELTYAKRYALCAMLGVAAEEDDDGNSGSGNKADIKPRQPTPEQQQSPAQPPRQHKPTPAANGEFASPDQINEVVGLLADREDAEALMNKWFGKANAKGWQDMPADATTKCIEYLKKKQPAKAA